MRKPWGATRKGQRTYHARQYTIIAAVAIPLLIVLWLLQSYQTAIGFAIGGVLSGAAGFLGMNPPVRPHTPGAEAARRGGPPAPHAALKGGSGTGVLVVGLAVLGASGD